MAETLERRRARISDLITRLGGKGEVKIAISRGDSALKAWSARGAISGLVYGDFLKLGAEKKVEIPRDLFGRSHADHWPP